MTEDKTTLARSYALRAGVYIYIIVEKNLHF